MKADTAPLTQAAGFTDSVAGIGAVFISTGTTTAESTAAEVFSTSNSAEGITGGLSNVQAAADTAQESSFQLPGRQLQVLPIGLGVFGGVSGIALLVVGIVTYERKRYRKQYRDRKNAERFNRPMKYIQVFFLYPTGVVTDWGVSCAQGSQRLMLLQLDHAMKLVSS